MLFAIHRQPFWNANHLITRRSRLRCRVPTLICLARTPFKTLSGRRHIYLLLRVNSGLISLLFSFLLAFIIIVVTLNAWAVPVVRSTNIGVWIYTKNLNQVQLWTPKRKHKLSICVRPWAAPTLNAQNAHKFSLYFWFFIHFTQRESNERHCDTATHWETKNMPSNFTTFYYIYIVYPSSDYPSDRENGNAFFIDFIFGVQLTAFVAIFFLLSIVFESLSSRIVGSWSYWVWCCWCRSNALTFLPSASCCFMLVSCMHKRV